MLAQTPTASTSGHSKSSTCTPATSTSSVSRRSSTSSTSSTNGGDASAVSVCRSLARHAGSFVKQVVKRPSPSPTRPKDKKPDLSKMRTVTPVYDHDLKRWVFPRPVIVHRDEPVGLPCKQLPASVKPVRHMNG